MSVNAQREKLFSAFAAALVPVEEAEGPRKGLRRYQIGKTGPVKRFFGTINIEKKHFLEAVANFKANAAGITHPQTNAPAVHWDYSHDDGGKAAGWIHDLETDGEGLYAWTRWTPKAEQALSDGEFIGSSMEIDFAFVDNEGKEWGTVLLGCALTNIPAITGMTPVALQQQALEKEQKMLKELLEKYKAASAEDKASLLKEILKLAGVNENIVELHAAQTTELAELKTKLSQGADAATKAEITKLQNDLAAANEKLAKQAKEAQFAEMLSKGHAVPAQKDAFLAGDMAQFAALAGTKVNLGKEGGSGQGSEEGAGAGALTAKDAAEAGAKLTDLAEKFAAEKKVGFREALSAVRRDPANAELVKKADA